MKPENPYREPLPRYVHGDFELIRQGREQGWDECQQSRIDAGYRKVPSVYTRVHEGIIRVGDIMIRPDNSLVVVDDEHILCGERIYFEHHKRPIVGCQLVCGETGNLVYRFQFPVNWQFWDYSWICPSCGGRHCSECDYESDGITIIVHDCGRFLGGERC